MSNDKEVKQDGKNAVPVAPATANAAGKPAVNEDRLSLLIELLLGQKQEELEKVAAEKQRRKALAEQREKSQTQNAYNLLKLQARCTHLKGKGKRVGKHETQYADRVNDPNVMMHTFIDGMAVIKCLSCGARWKQGDTRDFLLRNGVKVPNVTKMGWTEALGLVQRSSNTHTSSEVPGSQFGKQGGDDFVVPEGFEF